MTPEESNALAAPRRPWIAVLLSALLPGLGQLYDGRPRRAIAMWVSCTVLAVLVLASAAVLPATVHLLLFALLLVLVPLVIVIDAARIARVEPLVARRWYDRWYVYLALVVLSSIVWAPFTRMLRRSVLEAYAIPGGSMAPTILHQDYILVTKLDRPHERGRLAVYTHRGQTQVKRIVGIPGDTLQMRDGVLLVDGRRVMEPYAQPGTEDSSWPEFAWQTRYLTSSVDSAQYEPSMRNWGPLVVPARRYFMLGDNRGGSLDSRFIGFVPAESIIGRPASIYFSLDPETRQPRWSRIGTDLRE